jgi:hypothetical protein
LNTLYAPATKSRGGGHINLPPVRPSVHPDIDTWFVRLSPPTVLIFDENQNPVDIMFINILQNIKAVALKL